MWVCFFGFVCGVFFPKFQNVSKPLNLKIDCKGLSLITGKLQTEVFLVSVSLWYSFVVAVNLIDIHKIAIGGQGREDLLPHNQTSEIFNVYMNSHMGTQCTVPQNQNLLSYGIICAYTALSLTFT